jgi:spermidine synthase
VLALTLVTGFAGLVYEVVWQRYVAILLGSDSESIAAVLGLFLGGLALGYGVFGAWTRRIVRRGEERGAAPPLLSLYGGVELLIGLYALIFPWAFSAIQWISLGFPASGAGASFAVDVLLTALLIGPPSFLMGATIPMLTQALPRHLEESTQVHAWVYGLNTAGAFAGALAAGFYFIPQLGLVGTVRAMGGVNLAAGLILAGLGASGARSALPAQAPEPVGARSVRGYGLFAAAALLSGFAMMSLQTVLNRLGALALGASHFTFSIVVATFVFSIALGSLAVSQFRRIPPIAAAVSQWLLAALLIAMYAFATHLNYGAHVLRTLFQSTDAAFFAFHFAVFLCVLVIFVLPIGLSGALLPLLFHILRREAKEWGAVAGRLYSWNTFGSLLGALLGGYVLLFWVDLHTVFRVASLAVALSAALLSFRLAGPKARVLAMAALASVLVVMVSLPPWPARVLAMGAFKVRTETPETLLGSAAFSEALMSGLDVLFHVDGPNASATVLEELGTRALYVNGKSDGNSRFDYPTMSLGALIPALLAERAERAFVVGYGLGITVGELAALDSTRSVVVAEISKSVIDAAPLFDAANLNARQNSKVEIVRGDAYRALLRGEGLYDLIISEPSHPWVLGVEMVFSREFLEQARTRLHPHGIYAQWIHRDEMDAETLDLVFRTYASVFEDISVWYALNHDLVLIGFNRGGGVRSLDRIIERASRSDVREAFARLGMTSLSGFLAHEVVPVGVIAREHLPGAVHTLEHPRLSHAAAKAFFRDPPMPPIPRALSAEALRAGARNSLASRYAAKLDAESLETHRQEMVAETCKHLFAECIVLLAEWIAKNPASAALQSTAAQLQATPRMSRALSSGAPDLLSALYDGSGRALPERLSLAAARSWETTFFSNYHYAAPFAPEILPEIWRRCADEDPALCEEGLRDIEQKLK